MELSNRITIIFFLTVLFVIVFIFSTTTRSITILKTLSFYSLILIFTFLILLSSYIKKQKVIFKISEIKIPFIIFLIYSFFNLLTLLQYGHINLIWTGIEEYYGFITYFLLILFIYQFINKFNEVKLYISILLYFSLIPSIFGLIQYFKIFALLKIDTFKLLPKDVAYSTFGNKNFFAGFLVLVIPLSLSLFCYEQKLLKKIVFLITFLILLFSLLITFTRGAYIGIFAGIVTFFLLNLISLKKYFVKIIVIILIISICLSIILLKLNIFENVKDAVVSIFSFSHGTNLMRITTYKSFFRAAIKNPLTGVGIGTFQLTFPFFRDELYSSKGLTHNTLHAHNEYLEILGEQGIIGLVLFLWFIYILLYLSIKKFFTSKYKPYKWILSGLIASILGALAHNIFSVNLRMTSTSVIFYFLVGLTIVLIKKNEIQIKFKSHIIFIIIIGTLSIFLFHFFFKIYKSQTLLQLATSYERPDSVFLDGKTGKHSEKLRNQELIKLYKNTLECNPYSLSARYKLSSSLYKNKYYNDAIKEYNELKYYAPRYTQINFNISLVYFMMKNIKEALYYQGIATGIENSKKNFKQLSSFYYDLGMKDLSIHLIKKTIKMNRLNSNLYNLLGYKLFEKKYFIEAVNTYLFLTFLKRENDINCIESYKNIGVIYMYNLMNPDRAKKYFLKYIELTKNKNEKRKVLNILSKIK